MSGKIWIILDSITQIQSQPLSQEKLQDAIYKMSESDFTRFYFWTEGWSNWQNLNEYLNANDNSQKIFNKSQELTKTVQFVKGQSHHNDATIKVSLNENVAPEKKNSPEKNDTLGQKSLTRVKSPHENTFTNTSTVQSSHDYNIEDITKLETTAPPKTVDFDNLQKNYQNRAERHELKIEILLINQRNKTFRSFSRNISLSGTLLEDNVPSDFYGSQFDLVVVNRHSSKHLNSRVQVRAETVGDGLTRRIHFVNLNPNQIERLTDLLNTYLAEQHQLKTG